MLVEPALDEIPAVAAGNRKLLEGCTASVAGHDLRALRRSLRATVIPSNRLGSDSLLIASGHQPGLHHPGVFIKHVVLGRLGPLCVCVNFDLDSDVTASIAATVPTRNAERVVASDAVLVENPEGVACERLPVPSRAGVEAFVAQVDASVDSLGNADVAGAWRAFHRAMDRAQSHPETAGDLLTTWRTAYFPTPNVTEVRLSALCDHEAFRALAADMIWNAPRVAALYNGALETYRREHKIRNEANPFPNLRVRDGSCEIPFWRIGSDGRRHHCFVQGAPERRLFDENGLVGPLASTPGEVMRRLSAFHLRPKAVTLTLFVRLFLADLFLHGVSGANYEAVTDAVLGNYFGIEPPRYGVASRTLLLPVPRDERLADTIERLRNDLRQIDQNPDRFLPAEHPRVREKREILDRAKDGITGEMHQRLRQIREALLSEVRAARRRLESEVGEAERRQHAEAALWRRDYAYFLFPLDRLTSL